MSKPCAKAGCPNLTKERYCEKHRQEVKQDVKRYDKERGSAHERGYTSRWQKYRITFLKRRPICECDECVRLGRVLSATVVDHVIPHKGDQKLFWDPNNHKPMAKKCHDRKTAREDGGFGR